MSSSRAHALAIESEIFVMGEHFASTLASGVFEHSHLQVELLCTCEWSYNEIVNNLHRIQVKDLLAFIISNYYAVSLPDILS